MQKPRRGASTNTVERTVVVGVSPGLGVTLARKVHEEAMGHAATVTIKYEHGGANARSLFALLSLGVRVGDSVSLSAEGPDANEAITAITQILQGEVA